MQPPKIIKQDWHRNGMGGEGFVVSLMEWGADGDAEPTDLFVGISFGETQDEFISHTAVLKVDELVKGNIEFARGNSWRGADHCGPAIVETLLKDDPTYFEENR